MIWQFFQYRSHSLWSICHLDTYCWCDLPVSNAVSMFDNFFKGAPFQAAFLIKATSVSNSHELVQTSKRCLIKWVSRCECTVRVLGLVCTPFSTFLPDKCLKVSTKVFMGSLKYWKTIIISPDCIVLLGYDSSYQRKTSIDDQNFAIYFKKSILTHRGYKLIPSLIFCPPLGNPWHNNR